MALPALGFFGLFALLPLAGVVVLSLTSWDGIGEITWAGFANWADVLGDSSTYNAIWLSVKFMIGCWLVQTPISLLLGVLVAARTKYRAVLGVLYFIPMLMSAAAIATAFKALLDPNFGMSLAFGLEALSQDWFGPDLAFYVIVFVVSWQFIPFHLLLYQAGVRQIPPSMYEAATIDGAGRMRQFFHITLPQLRYTIITSSTLILVGSLTYFDLVYVLTGGGPGTRLLPIHMYLTGFSAEDMGRGSVLAVLLAFTGLVLALGLSAMASFRRGSQQEGA